MYFLEIVLKNLVRRKSRSLLTAAGLATAAATSMLLLSVSWGYANSAINYFNSCGVDIVVVRAGVAERITSSLNSRLAERLRDLPQVSQVEGTLSEMASLGESSLIGIPVRGLDPSGFALAHYAVIQGRTLQSGATHNVLLGESLAKSLQKMTGDHVDIEDVPFRVAGVFQTGDALESNSAVVRLSDLQGLMDRPGQVSEFQIRLSPSADQIAARRLCDAIEALGDADGTTLGFKAMLTRDFVGPIPKRDC